MRTEIGSVRTELGALRTEIGSIKADVNAVRAEIKDASLNMTRWMIGTILAATTLAFIIARFVGERRVDEPKSAAPAAMIEAPLAQVIG